MLFYFRLVIYYTFLVYFVKTGFNIPNLFIYLLFRQICHIRDRLGELELEVTSAEQLMELRFRVIDIQKIDKFRARSLIKTLYRFLANCPGVSNHSVRTLLSSLTYLVSELHKKLIDTSNVSIY